MKLIQTIKKEITETIDIFCNKCGMSCKGHCGNWLGLIEAKVSGGYDSTHLNDGDMYQFSLCEHCLKELIDSFQLYAKQGNYLFPEDDEEDKKTNPEWYDGSPLTKERIADLRRKLGIARGMLIDFRGLLNGKDERACITTRSKAHEKDLVDELNRVIDESAD